MARNPKKRNKKYRGADAKSRDELLRVHKTTAVVRSDFAQWFYERRVLIRNILIGVAIAAVIVAGIFALVK